MRAKFERCFRCLERQSSIVRIVKVACFYFRLGEEGEAATQHPGTAIRKRVLQFQIEKTQPRIRKDVRSLERLKPRREALCDKH